MRVTRSEFLKMAGAAAGLGLLATKAASPAIAASPASPGAAAAGKGAAPSASPAPAAARVEAGGEARRFRAAVLAGDLPRVTAFLGVDPALAYSRDERGRSLLALAYLGGQREAAELLRPHLASLDLVEATLAGDRERVSALLGKAPGLLNEIDPVGFTAVQAAVLAGRPDLLTTMATRGADWNALSADPPRRSAVRLAVELPDPAVAEEIADLMLGNGGDPNTLQGDGVTPLHAAARRGDTEVIRLLVWSGADAAARTPAGETALDLALREGRTAAAALLRREATLPRAHRTSRYAATADGSPFAPRPQPAPASPRALPQAVINEYVAVSHGNLARVKELLALYPSLLLVNASWNELAVEAGAHVGFKDGVRLQLDSGAPCALPTAAMMGMGARVRALLVEDPGRIRDCGAHNMPLAWFPAIGGGSPEQLEIARFLLDRGLDVDAHKRGQTALHWAARGGHVEMAELLLDRGADVNARAKLGNGTEATPLATARKAERKGVADLLVRRGGTV